MGNVRHECAIKRQEQEFGHDCDSLGDSLLQVDAPESRLMTTEPGGETGSPVDPVLSPLKVGIAITCAVCRQQKQPVGRSAPLGSHLCDWDCPGYRQEPRSGSLWPGESEADFGFPVDDVGTKRKEGADR